MSRIRRVFLVCLLCASATLGVDGPPITGIGGDPIFEYRPELINFSPCGIVSSELAGVYDGKLCGKAYGLALATSDSRNLQIYTTLTTATVYGWYANPAGVFVVRVAGGNLYINKHPATLDGAWRNTDAVGTTSAAGDFQVAAAQLPASVEYAGAGRVFWGEYCTAQATTPDATPALVYSSNYGDSWAKLVESSGGAVRHFHGVRYFTTGWLRVWCTTAGADNAYVEIESGPVIKLWTYTDPDYTLVSTLTWANFQSVNDLVTAINAADGTNWHAELVVDRNGDHYGNWSWKNIIAGGPSTPDATYGYPCYDTAGQTGRNAQVLYPSTVAEGDRVERLYLFSGDAAPLAECADQSSSAMILKCDNIPDLITNPATWKTNWTLDVTGTDRDSIVWAGKTNVIAHSTQDARVVNAAINSDGLYYIPDRSDGAQVCFVDHWTGQQTPTVLGGTEGSNGWDACTVNGVPVVSNVSWHNGTSYEAYNDAYVRLYAVAPASKTVKLVAKLPRYDEVAPNNQQVRVHGMSGYRGILWFTTNYGVWSPFGLASHAAFVSCEGRDQHSFDRSLLPISPLSAPASWRETAAASGGAWSNANTVVATDGGLYPPGETSSIKVPSMTLANKATYGMSTITSTTIQHTTGWVSFWAQVYCADGTTSAQRPAIRLHWRSSASGFGSIRELETSQKTPTWKLIGTSVLSQPEDSNSLYAYIYGHYTGTLATGDFKQINFASPQLCRGQLPMLQWQRRAGVIIRRY